MKNAVVAWIDEENGRTEKYARACIDAFRTSGYGFFETRFLYGATEKELCAAVVDLNVRADNVFLLAPKKYLSQIGWSVQSCLRSNYIQANALGEGMISHIGCTLFFLSFEGGKEYAKTVCVPFLEQKSGDRRGRIVLRFMGLPDEKLCAILNEAEKMAGNLISFHHFEKYDETVLEILYNLSASKILIDDVIRLFAERLEEYLYALDDTTLEEQLVQLLKMRGKKVSIAESFTGGGVARRIVSVSGASEVYFEGLNTYAEESKMIRLGVLAYTLNTSGAVSDKTAYEMAAGLLATQKCDIAIATTGIAGPKSDKTGLPVGLSYIAVGTKEKIYVCRYHLDGSREEITEKAINYALFDACRLLKKI